MSKSVKTEYGVNYPTIEVVWRDSGIYHDQEDTQLIKSGFFKVCVMFTAGKLINETDSHLLIARDIILTRKPHHVRDSITIPKENIISQRIIKSN